jgi:two-component system CheB/CheR fusion protein
VRRSHRHDWVLFASADRPLWQRCAFAATITLGVAAVRVALIPWLGTSWSFVLAYPALILSAWYGGPIPGLLSAGISALNALVFVTPPEPPARGLQLTVFCVVGAIMGLLIDLMRRAQQRQQLQAMLCARTDRAERTLREREHLLGVITDAAPALIAYVDRNYRYQIANRMYQRWFGRDPAHMKGRHVSDVLGDSLWQTVRPYMERALAGQEVAYEEELEYRDGGKHWVNINYAPDLEPSGHVRGFVVLAHDITDRKAAEVAEQHACAEAEMSNRAKDKFLAALSHELRTPLTPVLGAAAMLESRRAALPEDVFRLITLIRKNAELEARLIDDLLDLTRINRGKLALYMEPTDAHETIHDVIRACESDAEARQLRVDLQLGATEHNVLADQARFRQVIWSLVKNAIKYSHPGGQIVLRTCNEQEGKLSVDVTDEGIGIDRELLPRLFNAFEQGASELARPFGGLGLGLAIGKALIEAQGGTVQAASAGQERGSTFTVKIPLAPSTPSASLPADDAAAKPPLARRRILLVEDHIDTSVLLTELLELQGYRVRTAETVADALRLADSEEFDLVLSDLGLPDGTGHDLMRQLRARHKLNGVALSGYGLENDVREAKAAGFAEHLTKPVNPSYLLQVLSRVMESGPQRVTG